MAAPVDVPAPVFASVSSLSSSITSSASSSSAGSSNKVPSAWSSRKLSSSTLKYTVKKATSTTKTKDLYGDTPSSPSSLAAQDKEGFEKVVRSFARDVLDPFPVFPGTYMAQVHQTEPAVPVVFVPGNNAGRRVAPHAVLVRRDSTQRRLAHRPQQRSRDYRRMVPSTLIPNLVVSARAPHPSLSVAIFVYNRPSMPGSPLAMSERRTV